MTRPKPPARIETERLILRRHELADAPQMFAAIETDRERLAQWLPWVKKTQSVSDTHANLEVCRESWELGDLFDYGFYTKNGCFVGRGGLHSINWAVPKGEFGYWLTGEAQGKGFISEALRALEVAFFHLGFERLEVRCDPLNRRSSGVPQRLGYRLEAVLSRESRHNGKLRDTMIWAKLRRDEQKEQRQRPSCIGHWSQFIDPDDCHYPGSEEILSQGSRLGHHLGLKAIGVHHEILPPGRRTSWPHAEMLEEEFAFVLEGTPDVWIDGHLYPLVAGDFVAFPAGTGSAHVFINNSESVCKLLVGGEATKAGNKIHYPLHPERMDEIRQRNLAWDDPPKRELGPHDGRPNRVR